MVDEETQKKISNFHTAKNGMVELAQKHLHRWKLGSDKVVLLMCGNAGENKKLRKRIYSKYWNLNAVFECTLRSPSHHD